MRIRTGHIGLAGALLLLLVAFPSGVAAHSEFVSGTPKNGATVQSGPIDIVGTFTETLNSRSHIELLDAASSVIAHGAVDGKTLRIGLEGIEPGEYQVQWTSVAQDGDILRSSDNPDWTWRFTVAAASPSLTPSVAPSQPASAPPSARATVKASAAPSPSAPPTSSSGASTGDLRLPILAALVVIALLGALLVRRRTPAGR